MKLMGLRRKAKKALAAEARLWNAQAAQVEQAASSQRSQDTANKWGPVVEDIESGRASYDDLTRMEKMSMPLSYQLRCRAAQRMADGNDNDGISQ